MNRVRIWATLNGYKTWQPETKRKYPVLPGMLTWIKRHLTSDTLSDAIRWSYGRPSWLDSSSCCGPRSSW